MSIVTGDRYLESLVKFVENVAGPLIEGTLVLKLNPVGLHYVQSRLEALAELESLLAGAPVDYLRAYVSDLGDHRALEQLRRILRLLTSLKVVSVLPPPVRDPTPLSLLPFGRLRVLELRGCDLSTSAARGLLELRHTLEKLICHNSTDALRHVFASRIAEIKDSPNWNRLNFVSCACNGLFLMDESLQLLPVVETLDLSRNKFTKVDNLRKCTKLKHLDLGFNQLRTIVSLNEVYRQIVKLVLRNNALTTLRGIENLQSLEGLDLSYNILSNFSQLEILSGLLSLKSLWLEGNPLCSARWYRPQVFSFFPHPDELELDDKKICTRELWKRQIIIASRQKRPASFGFYFTAKDDAGLEGTINTKQKKLSRLADIESEGQSTCVGSDQESVSCDNQIQGKEENVALDDEAEIVDLMNRIELMKKERSNLWLEEFKGWMNQASDISVDDGGNYSESKTGHKHLGESSRYVADSLQSYGEENSMNIPESDNSVEDMPAGFSGQQYVDRIDEAVSKNFTGHAAGVSVPLIGRSNPNQDNLKSYYIEGTQLQAGSSHLDSCKIPAVDKMKEKKSVRPLAAIDDIMESYSSSACLGSPPHYQEDILQRRQNLEEEFLQLSAESYSIASSDSNTSYSDDDSAEFVVFIPQDDPSVINKLSDRSVDDYYSSVLHSVETSTQKRHNVSQFTQNGKYSLDSRARQNSGIIEHREQCTSPPLLCYDSFSARAHDGETVCHVKQKADWLENKKYNRRSKRRVISLTNENNMDDKTVPAHEVNGSLDVSRDDVVVDERKKQVSHGSDRHTCKKALATSNSNDSQNFLSETKLDYLGTDDIIMNYFRSNVSDSVVQETCRQYMRCNCILEEISECKESEVAVLQSSEQKLYMLLISSGYDGSDITLSQIGCHKMEDVKEAIVGLGLLVVRVYIGRNGTYRFVTRSLEKSRQLFCILDIFDSYVPKDGFSMRSFELVQVDFFVRRFFRGSNVSIFQYSMVLFWSYTCKEDLWLPRSLFVLERHLLVCIEDLLHFGSFSEDSSYSSYFALDSCCSIVDVREIVCPF